MAEKLSVKRPEAPKINQTEKGSSGKITITPADVNAEIAKMKAISAFMDKSGTLAISSKLQIAHLAIFRSLTDMGFDLSDVVDVYETFEQRSPNLDGIGRSQVIQALTAPTVLIPGVGRMENVYPEKPGFFRSIYERLTGSGKGQAQ